MRTGSIQAVFLLLWVMACDRSEGGPGADGVDAGAGGGEGSDGDGTDGGLDVACGEVTLEPRCTTSWYDDGECDPGNNLAECEWDGGDCCASTCTGDGCGDYGYECRDPDAGGGGAPVVELIGMPCAEVSDPFAADRLQDEVSLLASDALAGRRPGTAGDLMTRRYIEERFRCMGLAPAVDSCYQQPFHAGDGEPTGNVLGYLPGSDPSVADEIIVVGGHHDHLGVEDGVIHNGANDNASGTVGVLAIADTLRRLAVAPRRTILFVTFGSEEAGLEGAIHLVDHPPAGLAIEDVVYMVNLDMLGTYDDVAAGEAVSGFGTFVGTPGRGLLDEILEDHPDLHVNRGIASPEGDSDYDPFCDAGIPYVYFETFDTCWHEACDDAARMDYAHMSELLVVLKDVIVGLGDSELDLSAARDEVGCSRQDD